MAIVKQIKTAYALDVANESGNVEMAFLNAESGDQSLTIQIGEGEPVTLSTDDAVEFPKFLAKLNREAGRTVSRTRVRPPKL